MVAVRGFLAVCMIVLGAVVLARTLAFGIRMETISGVVLGAAMVALGVHRIALIARMRGSP